MPEGTVPYGNKLYITGSTLNGDVVNDDIRSMALVLESSTVNGAIRDAYVELKNSKWTASGDSRVCLVNATAPDGIDAPAGVRITAAIGAGTTLRGEYDLPSGGKLIVG